MTPTIATRDDWLAARRALLVREKELTRQADALARERRELPWVRLETDYAFDSENGPTRLSALFGEASQLVVYHFMFGADWEEGCKSCSFWADSFNGLGPHLKARDIAFAAVSGAPIERLVAFRERMGWSFNWVSSQPSSFNTDFHVGFTEDQPSKMYNFEEVASTPMDEMHGTSVFAIGPDGALYHTYSTYGRGLDVTNAAYSYIDLTPKGRDEPAEGNPMAWVRHHDRY